MKKITIVSLFFVGMSLVCIAQKSNSKTQKNDDTIFHSIPILKEPRFLLNIHTGFAYGLGSTFKFYPDDIRSIAITKSPNNPMQQTISYRNPWKGLGDGVRIGGGFSYILNDFINIGLDVDYFESTINKIKDSSFREIKVPVTPADVNDYSYKEHSTISYNATLVTLTPNVTFKAISRPKWFIYNKVGAVITFRPNSLQDNVSDITIRKGVQGNYKDSTSKVVKKYDWGIKNPAFGFMGAFGMQVKVAKKIRAFAECQFSHIVFVVRKRTLTDFTVGGKDMKNTLPVSMRELDFVKSFSTNFSSVNPNEPSQTLIQRIPITYVGVQVGLSFQFR